MKIQIKPIVAVASMVLTVLILYGIGCRLIYKGVLNSSRGAQDAYGGEPVTALIALAGDEKAPLEKRNSAIWALGQIGDERSLPVLNDLRTGEVQAKPYDSTAYIVQYSVEKAIRQVNGLSVTRWMYRWLD